MLFIANDKILTFKRRLEFWNTLVNLIAFFFFDSFLILKDFSVVITGDICECEFLILNKEMCQLF